MACTIDTLMKEVGLSRATLTTIGDSSPVTEPDRMNQIRKYQQFMAKVGCFTMQQGDDPRVFEDTLCVYHKKIDWRWARANCLPLTNTGSGVWAHQEWDSFLRPSRPYCCEHNSCVSVWLHLEMTLHNNMFSLSPEYNQAGKFPVLAQAHHLGSWEQNLC